MTNEFEITVGELEVAFQNKDDLEYWDESSNKWRPYRREDFLINKGFPDPKLAEEPVCLISIRDNITQKTITFGEKEYTNTEEDVIYVHCPNEKDLLRKFFTYLADNPPDVYSGWNIMTFDLIYLINRDKRINDGKYYNLMSPIQDVRTWNSEKGFTNIDIGGTTILDYMDIYKWYTPHNLERYSLDYVAKYELEEGKLDYSHSAGSLRELYSSDWDTYVRYNIIDCKRVAQLGKKLGYIRLIQSISLLTKSPMKYYNKQTQLIEGMMLTFFRRNGLCAPILKGGTQEAFEAAYVKEPQVGRHEWLFSIDITSSYPSHIITLNMSNETFFGRILHLPEESITEYTRDREFPEFKMMKEDKVVTFRSDRLENFNLALKKKLLSIAPCGSVFTNKKIGVMAQVERNGFDKRKQVKKMMKEADSQDERDRLFSLQWAIKILLNAMFGITAVPYSRYHNSDISEAITSCGRHTLKMGMKYGNDILNNPDNDLLALMMDIRDEYKKGG